MNIAELHRKLIDVARVQVPADRVPPAFEKRIMALVREQPVDWREFWGQALWRGAMACLAVMIVFGALSLVVPRGAREQTDLSQQFESTMLASMASVDQEGDSTFSQ